MLSMYGCRCQRVPLADDVVEDASDTLGLYPVEGARGHSAIVRPPLSVVRAVDKELLDISHGVAEIRDERPSPISLLLCPSGFRSSRSAVSPTSSAGSTTG